MARRRRGRGRLSSIELLPEEAADIVVWASQQIAARDRTLTDIYAEFRQKLIALQGEQGLSFDIPAFSSFHRYSVYQAELAQRLTETREIANNLAARLDGIGNEDVTVLAIETLKVLILEIVRSRGHSGLKPKEAMEMARALQSVVATSKMSQAQRQSFERELEAATEDAIDKAAAVAKEAGVSAEAIAQMRREFLGVRAPSPGAPSPGAPSPGAPSPAGLRPAPSPAGGRGEEGGKA